MSYNFAPYASKPPPPCSGRARPGVRAFMAYMMDRYKWSTSMGIYNCRPPSRHSDGSAWDQGIPTGARGAARPELGMQAIELVCTHGKRLGITLAIYNRRVWSAGSPNGRPYTGKHPHYDHIHWDFTNAAAQNLTYATLVAVLGPVSGAAPKPQPTNGLNAGQLKWLAQSVGLTGEDVNIAAAVALAESRLPGSVNPPLSDPRAFNGKAPDASYGAWQINTHGNLGPDRRAKLGLKSNDELFDPATNARAMKLVLDEAGPRRWKAWATFTSGSYKTHLPHVRAAAPQPINGIKRKEIDMFIAKVDGHSCLFQGGGIAVHIDSSHDVDRLKAAGIPELPGGDLDPDFANSHLIIMNAAEATAFWGPKVAADA